MGPARSGDIREHQQCGHTRAITQHADAPTSNGAGGNRCMHPVGSAARCGRSASPTIATASAGELLIGWFYRGYAAFEHGHLVGEGLVTGNTADNVETARLWVWVPPDQRGRGVGGAVAEFLVQECRHHRRRILHSSAKYPFDRRANPPLPPVRRAAWIRPRQYPGGTSAHVAGRRGHCDLYNRLSLDSPGGDLRLEQSRRTPQILADQDAELCEQGRTRVTVLGLDTEGSVVAFSCAVVTVAGQPHVDQWATIVSPDHRGHRLGLAVKVAQVTTIQERFPDKRFITTTNAETNTSGLGCEVRLALPAN
ncbi:MAG: hypothetical protein ACR2KG_06025 [Nocardioidaceae bacterium]